MHKQDGLTLIELLVVIAVLGFLLGVGVPSFTSFIRDNRIDATANRVISNLNYARSEATSRSAVITLERKGGTANAWSTGWEIYTDADAGGNSTRVGGDLLLRDIDATSEGIDIISDAAGEPWISYRANGMLNEGGNPVVIAICDDRGAADGLDITINLAGRVTLTAPSADCTP